MESKVAKPTTASNEFLIGKNVTRRKIKDKAAHIGVTVGGIMVFIALLLIFFYLLYVVKPVFDGAKVEPVTQVSLPENTDKTLMVGSDEQNELLYRVGQQGQVDFFRVKDGMLTEQLSQQVPLPEQANIIDYATGMPNEQTFAYGLDNGEVLIGKVSFAVTYPQSGRLITPSIQYPLGSPTLSIADESTPLNKLTFSYNDEQMTFAYQDQQQTWHVVQRLGEENMMTEEVEWSSDSVLLKEAPANVNTHLITPDQRQLILQSTDKIYIYDIADIEDVNLAQVIDVKEVGANILQVDLLAGASSILITYDTGNIEQYFQVTSDKGRLYQKIRSFDNLGNVAVIGGEFYRKSFATITKEGQLSLLYTTSERELLSEKYDIANPTALGFSPRSNALIVEANHQLNLFSVDNTHPEISWSALWEKVWYEGYPEPQFIWQSTSGSDDFEAKLSLMPLAFGTLKAAFYAMLFAVPLAVAGAIYTAYFMTAKVRNVVKPTIELMEALPTVILGFLAGLWLAPLIEQHLPGLLTLFILLPVSILLSALLWSKLPVTVKKYLPEAYQEIMLIPVLLFVGWFSFAISPFIEITFFGGDSRQFITNELGMTFDQRNALVVGIAMGFAVIPTIFSIAEDAIYSVPRHLSNGSLALGATQWQTLTRVVLLTASPGIFSAIMMGLGRAVGETMIVLMATGNTAIMEWSVFQGMRTLAANIAVEMPESAIGSSHYRVLFLAAFVLFIFTFIFNTIAEVVRQRLRDRYSSL